jgi:hypothetical protein
MYVSICMYILTSLAALLESYVSEVCQSQSSFGRLGWSGGGKTSALSGLPPAVNKIRALGFHIK